VTEEILKEKTFEKNHKKKTSKPNNIKENNIKIDYKY